METNERLKCDKTTLQYFCDGYSILYLYLYINLVKNINKINKLLFLIVFFILLAFNIHHLSQNIHNILK